MRTVWQPLDGVEVTEVTPRDYLENALDTVWRQDAEYASSEAELRASFEAQNTLRHLFGMPAIPCQELADEIAGHEGGEP